MANTAPVLEHTDVQNMQPDGRIVVGVDGSAGSLAALKWAMLEARLRGSTVHAVLGWVHHPTWGYSGSGGMFPPNYQPSGGPLPGGLEPSLAPPPDTIPIVDEAAKGAVDDVLNMAVEQALSEDARSGQEPVIITSDVIQGHAARVLVDAAGESDLLVLGARGHGGFVGVLVGSVTQHVVSQARCPVVVVPTAADPAEEA
jgi:nucleotide-binding universal stress UspA family protein